MKPQISAITLGVGDVARARAFYADGLGWPVQTDYGDWVLVSLADGSQGLGLYPRAAVAADAGVPADGDGFAGIALSYIVSAPERVGEVLAEAERAGATITRPAAAESWGGVSGCFADPDGYVWKVAAGPGPDPFMAE